MIVVLSDEQYQEQRRFDLPFHPIFFWFILAASFHQQTNLMSKYTTRHKARECRIYAIGQICLVGLLWYLTPDEFRRVAIAVRAVPAGWHRDAVTK